MNIVALAGGVGGAKLADGLAKSLSPNELTIIVNTGDDFRHLGLHISPDLDTVCYTLAGLANLETGWGRADETYNLLDALGLIGGETWFRLGDKDLATHIERTKRLHLGQTLSRITKDFCLSWQVLQCIFPMSDSPVSTIVDTNEFGELSFQEYFVQKRCAPRIKGLRFEGIDSAQPPPGMMTAIEKADAIVICPSNPFVSIDPILSVPGIRSKVRSKHVVAVSPIIAGRTIKGPAAKIFFEMGLEPSAVAVADHYSDLLTGFVIDQMDGILAEKLFLPVKSTNTIMRSQDDRIRLAEIVLNLIRSL